MIMENEGPSGGTRVQICREAALQRGPGWGEILGTLLGLVNASFVAWCMRYVADACAFDHDVAHSDVCGHPTQYEIKCSSSSPL